MSVMVTVLETGLPAVTPNGRVAVFTATVKVSSSPSPSLVVVIVPEPLRLPPVMVMADRVPWLPSSEVPLVTVNGMVTAADRDRDRVAVTVTAVPSGTVVGDVLSVTSAGRLASGSLAPRAMVVVSNSALAGEVYSQARTFALRARTWNVYPTPDPSPRTRWHGHVQVLSWAWVSTANQRPPRTQLPPVGL